MRHSGVWSSWCVKKLHLTFLYVHDGTLEVFLREDLPDDHQQVEFAVVEVLRGAGGSGRRPRLALQG